MSPNLSAANLNAPCRCRFTNTANRRGLPAPARLERDKPRAASSRRRGAWHDPVFFGRVRSLPRERRSSGSNYRQMRTWPQRPNRQPAIGGLAFFRRCGIGVKRGRS